jgi:hypothetical protein
MLAVLLSGRNTLFFAVARSLAPQPFPNRGAEPTGGQSEPQSTGRLCQESRVAATNVGSDHDDAVQQEVRHVSTTAVLSV